MRITIDIDQSNDDPRDVITDPEEVRSLIEESLEHRVTKERRPNVDFGHITFTAVVGSVKVEETQ